MGSTPPNADHSSLSQRLHILARNLWWTWNPEAQAIFQDLSPQVWQQSNHNAVEVLNEVSSVELQARLHDQEFMKKVQFVLEEFEDYLKDKSTWVSRNVPALTNPIVYFSAEFGLHESLPIYSGGLGVLSGDHTKSASDLGLPFIGIGLYYRKGYFQQRIGNEGWQEEQYPVWPPEHLPLELVSLPEGGRLLNSVEIGDVTVYFQTWRLNVGRTVVYLLDTCVPENSEHYQGLTASVYGGNIDTRIGQEVVLGIGGVRLLKSMGVTPSCYHMNEGHSAFLVLELLREDLAAGKSHEEAEKEVRRHCVFTTHTPVPAGHDRFPSDLMGRTLGKYWSVTQLSHEHMMGFGRVNPADPQEPFTMTVMALKMSRAANGVSRIHGEVSRDMWQHLYPSRPVVEVPIGAITNGVHTPSWANARAHEFWNKRLGYDWTNKLIEPEFWNKIETEDLASDEELWALRFTLRRELVEFVRRRLRREGGRSGDSELPAVLSPDALTICFARRFATYKRAPLIFRNVEAMMSLMDNKARPVQLIFSGKAHPMDNEGKKFIQKIFEMTKHHGLQGKVVFVENYDMNVARWLVAGADVWLNNPRRPLEASGTSGMKVLIHGGLNLSVLDGWWSEGFNGKNGWAIGDHAGESDLDTQDRQDFENLYKTLKESVVPEFFDRDEKGIPRSWIARIRHSMKTLIPVYNTERMVAEYVKKYYVP